MNNRQALSAFALAASVPLLFSPTGFAIEPLEEIVEQKYEVDANATLSVANADGSIRDYAANAPDSRIQAYKKSYTQERLQGAVGVVMATRNSVATTTRCP